MNDSMSDLNSLWVSINFSKCKHLVGVVVRLKN